MPAIGTSLCHNCRAGGSAFFPLRPVCFPSFSAAAFASLRSQLKASDVRSIDRDRTLRCHFARFFEQVEYSIESHRVFGPIHGAPAPGRETVAEDVDDIDVAGSQGDALFENAGTLVDERIKAALKHFVIRHILRVMDEQAVALVNHGISALGFAVVALLLAGMMITSDHRAHMSTRNTVSCMGQGQASGTAAALCALNDWGSRELPYQTLRDELEKNGVYFESN